MSWSTSSVFVCRGWPSSWRAGRYRWLRRTWSAIMRSRSGSISSRIMYTRSKRDRSESCSPTFACTGLLLLYLPPYMGLAAASTEQRAFRDAWMPALAIVTVPCSMTSWMATRSLSLILSNSSIQTTPRSASTIAPASSLRSPVSLSAVTAAVRPTPEDPRPVVLMASGARLSTKRSSCDLAVDGSPTISTLMSPLRWVPFTRFFSTPPSSSSSSAFLMWWWPAMDGASEFVSSSTTFSFWEMVRMLRRSWSVIVFCRISFARCFTLFASRTVLKRPLV
mmetsp:Transcript_7124/g.12162  ORF Transcript_7124/g.12162 Transcript_7124/m.12162 type:complete len:279 (-) Transcript_7124:698-1534(-)